MTGSITPELAILEGTRCEGVGGTTLCLRLFKVTGNCSRCALVSESQGNDDPFPQGAWWAIRLLVYRKRDLHCRKTATTATTSNERELLPFGIEANSFNATRRSSSFTGDWVDFCGRESQKAYIGSLIAAR